MSTIAIKTIAEKFDCLPKELQHDISQELTQKQMLIIKGEHKAPIDLTLFSENICMIFVSSGAICQLLDTGFHNFLYIIADQNSHILYKKSPVITGSFDRRLYAYTNAFIQSEVHVVRISYTLVWNQYICAPGASIELKGGIIGCNNDQVSISTNQNHQYPQGNSCVLIKGIAKDASVISYCGLINIPHKAVNTVASQRSIFLFDGEKAIINSNPTMNVLTGSVQCAHATAIGMLSVDEIFYMQARGLSKESSECILQIGFFKEVNLANF